MAVARNPLVVARSASPVVSIDADGDPVYALANASGVAVDPNTPTAIGEGTKTVTTAATPVQLHADTAAKWVIITAQEDNTSKIAVGGTNAVRATIATGGGTPLNPGDDLILPVANLNQVWIDALVNGEGVRFTYGT
jgi:hypothetical protein